MDNKSMDSNERRVAEDEIKNFVQVLYYNYKIRHNTVRNESILI
jgi:hypothetical protein